jgi:histidyl-tRNA synthetase
MLGGDEAARGAVAVKDLRSGEQVEVPRAQLAGWLQARREADADAGRGATRR